MASIALTSRTRMEPSGPAYTFDCDGVSVAGGPAIVVALIARAATDGLEGIDAVICCGSPSFVPTVHRVVARPDASDVTDVALTAPPPAVTANATLAPATGAPPAAATCTMTD